MEIDYLYEQCRQLKNYIYSFYVGDMNPRYDSKNICKLFSPRRQLLYKNYLFDVHVELREKTLFRFFEAQILSSDIFSPRMKEHWLQMKTEYPSQYEIVIRHVCKNIYDPINDERWKK